MQEEWPGSPFLAFRAVFILRVINTVLSVSDTPPHEAQLRFQVDCLSAPIEL